MPQDKTNITESTADKDYLNSEQQAEFEKILLEWKHNIIHDNLEAKHKLQAETSPLPDLSDRASLEEAFALDLRNRDRDRKLLNKIDAALERLATKQFGYCQSCGTMIGLARLQARPTAELCIDCKELQEKSEIRVRNRTS